MRVRALQLLIPAAAATPHQVIPYCIAYGKVRPGCQHYTVVEAENFTTTGPGWEPREWARSPHYFASTVNNVFHSRRAYLHGPANFTGAPVATATVNVAEAGKFAVLVRYEALYLWDTPFEIEVKQGGQTKYKQTYGLRKTPKVWAYPNGRRVNGLCGGKGPYDVDECSWPWGANENMVWEYSNTTFATLAAGSVDISFTLTNQSSGWWPNKLADRNLDAVVLTQNTSDLETRKIYEYQVLSFDGYLHQWDEIFLKITNTGNQASGNLVMKLDYTWGHSPHTFDCKLYFPIRNMEPNGSMAPNGHPGDWHVQGGCQFGCADGFTCQNVNITPGQTTDWLAVGQLFDSFNHGSWNMPGSSWDMALDSSRQSMCPAAAARIEAAQKKTERNREPDLDVGDDVQWPSYTFEFADANKKTLATFKSVKDSIDGQEKLQLYYGPNTRTEGWPKIARYGDDFFDVYDRTVGSMTVHGKPPTKVPIYAWSFNRDYPRGGGSKLIPPGGKNPSLPEFKKYQSLQKEWEAKMGIYNIGPNGECDCSSPEPGCCTGFLGTLGYADMRTRIGNLTALDEYLVSLGSRLDNLGTVSLGDEITVRSSCVNCNAADCASNPRPACYYCFSNYLESQKVSLPGCGTNCTPANDETFIKTDPERYYWSMKCGMNRGIQGWKSIMAVFKKRAPKAAVGANLSPVAFYTDARDGLQGCQSCYIGQANEWVKVAREGGFTLQWGEDWMWQAPTASQQTSGMLVDAMRSGLTGIHAPDAEPYKEDRASRVLRHAAVPTGPPAPVMFYTMAHYPGNTARSWRRQFWSHMAKGVNRFDLFRYSPSFTQYTVDYVDADGGAYEEGYRSFNELGTFDDLVAAGHSAVNAPVGFLLSGTSDFYHSNSGSTRNSVQGGTIGTAKRTLYLALQHLHVPLDMVLEEDCEDGGLKHYDTVYVTEAHITEAAAKGLAAYASTGGTVVITAGAGTLNEYNAPNKAMAALLGFQQQVKVGGVHGAEGDGAIHWGKQELPLAEPLASVRAAGGGAAFAAVGAVVTNAAAPGGATVTATFDGDVKGTAAFTFKHGSGSVTYFAFHPGLSYAQPAMPMEPAGRGSTDDSVNHIIPVGWDETVRGMIAAPLAHIPPAALSPVTVSEALVEVGVLESAAGLAIVLVNWAGREVSGLNVTLTTQRTYKSATLATGGKLTEVASPAGLQSFVLDSIDVSDAIAIRF